MVLQRKNEKRDGCSYMEATLSLNILPTYHKYYNKRKGAKFFGGVSEKEEREIVYIIFLGFFFLLIF